MQVTLSLSTNWALLSPGDAWGYDVGDLKELHPDLLFVEELLLSEVKDLVALGPGVNIWQ